MIFAKRSYRDRRFYVLCCLAALVYLIYLPSLSGEFVLDDQSYITVNPLLRRPSLWYRFLFDRYSHLADPSRTDLIYRPVTAMTFGWTYLIGGANPFWFHLFSILLHAANTCLVFLLTRRLFARSGAEGLRVPIGVALIFCLHPAQVESVSYISARATLLSTLLFLVSFLLYLPDDPEGAFGGKGWRRVVSVAMFFFAQFSKEMFLLPVLMVCDLVYGMRGEPWKSRGRRWGPYVAVFGVYVLIRRIVVGAVVQRAWWGGSLWMHWQLAVHGLFLDIQNVVWPASLRVCYGIVPGPGFAWASMGMVAVLVIVGVATIRSVRQRKPEGFALAWFLLGLAPVANVVPVDALAADHFLYAPLIGAALFGGICLAKLNFRPACTAAAALGLILGLRTLEQEVAWQNPFILDAASYAAAPNDPCGAVNLSSYYYNWGMLGRSEALVRQALDERPLADTRFAAHKTLGLIRMKQMRYREAMTILDELSAEDPSQGEPHYLLGLCALKLADRRRAAAEFGLSKEWASRNLRRD